MAHLCKTCPTIVSGIRRFCDTCREQRRTAAWRKQGEERKQMYSEIDTVPYVIGRREPEEELNEMDVQLVDLAVSQFLTREGVRG
jgi:hypothetical protein